MKKVIIAAAALAALTTAAQAQTVRLGTEGAYVPWNFVNDAGELAGYEIDLGNAICEQAGLECEWVQNDWDSIIPNLLAGNYDVIMAGMSITEERKQTIDFSQEYYPSDPARFIVLAGNDIDVSNLEGARIGVQSNTIQAAYIEANLADKNTVIQFANPDQSIADLAAGNVDVILADGSFLESVAGGAQGAFELVGDGIIIGGGVGAGLRKEDTDLIATWNAALDALKADGAVNELIIEWFGEDGSTF